MTTSPFGGCKPSHYGSGEIAVTTSSGEARHHRIARFSLAVRQGRFHDTGPKLVQLAMRGRATGGSD